MKLGDFVSTIIKNKANNQFSLSLRARQLKKLGLTPEELIKMSISKPRIKKVLDIKKEKRK